MVRDLTVGRPGKVLLQYTLPLFGSIIFQQLYNLADSLVAGRYIGTDALAAVGNAYEVTLLYIAFAFGCNIGASVITAKFFGMKDHKSLRTTVYTALIASGVIGAVLTVLGLLLSSDLLHLIQTHADIFDDCLEYLNIYIAGFLFVLAYNIATGIFSAMGDSKTPFYFLAASSVSNVFMDILFVKEFRMGVAGVAWATFLCQGVSAVAAMAAMLLRLRKLGGEGAVLFSWRILGQIARVAVPSILQQGFISVGNIIIQGLINSFGTAATGGYAAAVKLNNMAITSVTAMGNGMSNYAAQNAGADKPRRIQQGLRSCIGLTWILCLLFMGLFLGFTDPLVRIFITDGNQTAAGIGCDFLRTVSPFYIVISCKLIMDGVLRGTGKMMRFMISTLADLTLRVTLAAVLSVSLGLMGIWMAWPVGWALATVLSSLLYLQVSRKKFSLPGWGDSEGEAAERTAR